MNHHAMMAEPAGAEALTLHVTGKVEGSKGSFRDSREVSMCSLRSRGTRTTLIPRIFLDDWRGVKMTVDVEAREKELAVAAIKQAIQARAA
jgi:hypothetical protein